MLSAEREESVEVDLLVKIKSAPDADLRFFEQLVHSYRGRIVANCRHITGDSSVADDLAQEVFVKAYFGFKKFEGRSSVAHWLRTIKVRHCLTHLKSTRSRVLLDISEEAVQSRPELAVPPSAEGKIDVLANKARVNEVLAAMPGSLRLVLVLRDMDDLSYDEIATYLDISLSAVKMRIKRAREFFRKSYVEMTATRPPVPQRANA